MLNVITIRGAKNRLIDLNREIRNAEEGPFTASEFRNDIINIFDTILNVPDFGREANIHFVCSPEPLTDMGTTPKYLFSDCVMDIGNKTLKQKVEVLYGEGIPGNISLTYEGESKKIDPTFDIKKAMMFRVAYDHNGEGENPNKKYYIVYVPDLATMLFVDHLNNKVSKAKEFARTTEFINNLPFLESVSLMNNIAKSTKEEDMSKIKLIKEIFIELLPNSTFIRDVIITSRSVSILSDFKYKDITIYDIDENEKILSETIAKGDDYEIDWDNIMIYSTKSKGEKFFLRGHEFDTSGRDFKKTGTLTIYVPSSHAAKRIRKKFK